MKVDKQTKHIKYTNERDNQVNQIEIRVFENHIQAEKAKANKTINKPIEKPIIRKSTGIHFHTV